MSSIIEKIKKMDINDIIDAALAHDDLDTRLAICENDGDGLYWLDDSFDPEELAEIICTGAFKKFEQSDFIEGSYLCVWASVGAHRCIDEAEAKMCKTEDEVKDYIISLINEGAIDEEDLFDDEDEDEEEEE